MKLQNVIPCLLAVCGPLVVGQTLTQEERDVAKSHLESTQKMLLDSIAGLSPGQLSFKSAPDRWSISECVEHITLSEDMLYKLATETIMKMKATKRNPEQYGAMDGAIMKDEVDRNKKMKAAKPLQPSNKWGSMDEMIAEFKKLRARTMNWVETTQDEARAHAMPNPEYKDMDAFQAILMLSAHTQRHTMQILEVKTEPNFPRS